MPAIFWLLLACCAQRSLAFRISHSTLDETIADFQAGKVDIALMLPLELSLQMRGSASQFNYDVAVDLLLDHIRRRHHYVQTMFHVQFSRMGFRVSSSRRISVRSGKLTLYYYAAFLGTTHLVRTTIRLKIMCHGLSMLDKENNKRVSNGTSCDPQIPVSLLYNLMLLNTFKYLPKQSQRLSEFFTDFAANATGSNQSFVVARNSDSHDIPHLLCNSLLRCEKHVCSMFKIMMPLSTLKDPFEWDLYDRVVSAVKTDSAIGNIDEFKQLMDFNFRPIFEDTGIYRSSCHCNNDYPANGCAPICSQPITVLALVLILVLLS